MFRKTNKKYLILGLVIGSVCLFGLTLRVNAEAVAKIIAKVNKQVITSRDLDEYCKVLQFKLSDSRDNIPSEDVEFRKIALSRLIEDKLILDEAKRIKMEIPRALVEDRLNEIIKSHPSREVFEESLEERGLTVTKLKEKIREQYLMRELIQMQVKSSIAISPQELNSYYSENKSQMLSPAGYIFYIATSKDEGSLNQIVDKIKTEGIAKALGDYQDELIRMESAEDELKPQIVGILEKLKGGQSEVAKMEETYYLVYMESKIDPRELTLSEAQEAIRGYLWDQKFKQKFSEWVKELKEMSVIKIYNE
ncbi:MAG: SurA N-terminal domain-containing protein [Candidatus Omnitrophica bacterium]|nr:SurA N-terminal domain-containing protein [Candidatus Omnitrophota bacterium]